MTFKEKKSDLKNDAIPFLVAIPAFLWMNAETGLGAPVLSVIAVPAGAYITCVVISLTVFWLFGIS